MMLSNKEPAFSQSLAEGRMLFVRSKHFEPELQVGQQLRFRLRANPTKKSRSGSRAGLEDSAQQVAWLQRKAEQHGFRLLTAHIVGADVVQTRRSDGGLMTHLSVDYHGVLEITDVGAFEDALKSGIGPGKAFGFGMLCIARAG